MSNRVAHFDISADDPERAKKFYEEAFGWKINKWQGSGMDYWMIETGPKDVPGINGGLSKRMDFKEHSYMNTIVVSNIDETIEKIKALGGNVIEKSELKGVGIFAQFTDTEGNIANLMQSTNPNMEM